MYRNDDPGFTLTYFTARSHWVAYMFEWGKLLQSHQSQIYVELPWEGRKEVYISGPGHMTKIAAMPIYGQNLQKSSPTEQIVL